MSRWFQSAHRFNMRAQIGQYFSTKNLPELAKCGRLF
jgi:hypothetical protein